MRGAIKYRKKEIIFISIFIGLYLIAIIYIASEYLSSTSIAALSY